MTGNAVRALRDHLHLSAVTLAALLHVSPSTVGRWEARGAEDAQAEGVAAALLYALHDATLRVDAPTLRGQLTGIMRRRGALAAVYYTLSVAFDDAFPARPERPVSVSE
jgi:transcriptional regulator with XRE-family HTH domain